MCVGRIPKIRNQAAQKLAHRVRHARSAGREQLRRRTSSSNRRAPAAPRAPARSPPTAHRAGRSTNRRWVGPAGAHAEDTRPACVPSRCSRAGVAPLGTGRRRRPPSGRLSLSLRQQRCGRHDHAADLARARDGKSVAMSAPARCPVYVDVAQVPAIEKVHRSRRVVCDCGAGAGGSDSRTRAGPARTPSGRRGQGRKGANGPTDPGQSCRHSSGPRFLGNRLPAESSCVRCSCP